MIVLWDNNGISIDGPLSLSDSVDQVKRFQAGGWRAELSTATTRTPSQPLSNAGAEINKPSLIACKTVIGYGAPTKAGTAKRMASRSAPEAQGRQG